MYDQNQPKYKRTYKPTGKAGVVGIPVKATSLEVGKEYHWFFSVVCNPKERSQDQVVEGAIKRIQPQQQLMTKLQNATPEDRVTLYAEAGIWQDSLATLAQLISSHPNDAKFKDDWKSLLTAQGVGLDQQLGSEPLLQGTGTPQSSQ